MRLTSSDALRADLLRDHFQSLGDLALILSSLPIIRVKDTAALACLPAALLLLVRPEFATSENVPRSDRHTLLTRHRNDLALKVTLEDTPCTLVNHEGSLSIQTGVCVCLGDNPGGSIRDTLRSGGSISRT